MATYALYSPDVEDVDDDESELADKIIAVMSKGAAIVEKREGRPLRASHAKAHALAEGQLEVAADLPPELAQGLFARPGTYRTVVRLAHVPGELLDDREVSTPRGLAMKVLDVDGDFLPTPSGERTQDWVLDTGESFNARNAKTFLAQITQTEASTPMPEGVKGVVSAVSTATNVALNAIGLNSAILDFFGHPKLNPLTETYYSQAPLRFGDYIAKLRVRPLTAVPDEEIAINEADGLRDIVTTELASRDATFAVEIQLCTDLDSMPIENASAVWSQDTSPYRQVATLKIPAQDTNPVGRDDAPSFSPAHSLKEHRPLGSVMRARMRVYEVMASRRRGGGYEVNASE